MRPRALLTVALVCCVSASTRVSAATAAPVPAPAPAAATFESAVAAIDRRFLAYQKEAHVPGLVWGIVTDGHIVHLGSSGVQDLETLTPVNADTLFRIASMSKAFTALAILKLRDDGKLSLDMPAETYVPELSAWTYPTTDSPRIRVRDLLSHAAGLVTDDPWGDRHQPMSESDFSALLREGAPFSHAPQMGFEYSNYGYALLGRIITNVSGKPYNEYIQEEIMRPLGMDSTGYEVRDAAQDRRALGYRWENAAYALEPTMGHGVFGAMGGVQTSAKDYAKWVSFLLAAWPPRDGAESGPVRRSTVRELAQGLNFPRVLERAGLDGDAPCTVAMTYGMGMTSTRECGLGFTLSHSGGYPGYGSNVLLMPDTGTGLFVFANRTYAGPSTTNRLAALELYKAELLRPRALAGSKALDAAYALAGKIYRAGSLEPAVNRLAMNFLMDRSRENWALTLAELKQQLGECNTSVPIKATGALSGEFTWTCDRGALLGQVLLAPTKVPGIQALQLSVAPKR